MARAEAAYGQLPLQFEANEGQTDANVKFLSRGRGYSLLLTPGEAILSLQKRRSDSSEQIFETAILRMQLLGANAAPSITGRDKLTGRSNYIIGNDREKWRRAIPTYARIEYGEVYPGTDLIYYGNQQQLEYDFIVKPGADPRAIRLAFEGADKIEVDGSGDLVLHVAGGEVRQPRPVVYQEAGGARREVAGAYVFDGGREVGFEIGDYDKSAPLVIDPIISYSTYLGGANAEQGNAIAVDSEGNVYITGLTTSFDFPVTPEAFQKTRRPLQGTQIYYTDAFVTKINPSGTGIIYSTFIGGSVAGDIGTSIEVDAAGNAYVAGTTGGGATASGYTNDFPTVNAFDATADSYDCPFVLKLNADGSALVYSTYLGAGTASRLALDQATGEVYVVGHTSATYFPTTPGAFRPSIQNGDSEGWVAKLSASGSNLVYATYLGGNGGIDTASDVEIDSAGNAYVSGTTGSRFFPVTPNAAQATCTGCEFARTDAFVVKLNPTGSQLLYATYFGGSLSERATGIALDPSGNIFITGRTESSSSASKPYPTTPGAFQTTSQGIPDAFVTKFSNAGAVIYSTYLGGNVIDEAYDVSVDPSGNAHVTGRTRSLNSPKVNAFTSNMSSGTDYVFISTLNQPGTAITFSTIFGTGSGHHIVYDNSGHLYVTGVAYDYVPLVRPLQPQPAPSDAFVAKIAVTGTESTPVFITGQIVTTDGRSPAGISIKLTGSQTGFMPTDAQGRYSFPVVPGGNYTIEPLRMDWNFSPAVQTFHNVTGDRQAETIYASTNIAPTARMISPVEGAVYTAPATILLKAEASDEDGTIQKVEFWSNDPALLFTDTEAPYEYEWKNVPANSQLAVQVAVVDNASTRRHSQWVALTVNAASSPTPTPTPTPTYSIGGTVRDASGAPLSGVSVALGNSSPLTVTTAADGTYLFSGLKTGESHTLTPSKAGYTFSPSQYIFDNLSANRIADFTATLQTFALSGRVTHGADGLAGVAVALSGTHSATATTDATGAYRFENLTSGGNYTMTPTRANFRFTPPNQTFNNLASDQTANFTATSVPASIQFTASNYTVGEGEGAINITVMRAVNSTTAVNVSYSMSGGNATSGDDYTATSGTLSFAAGEVAKTLSVSVLEDAAVEGVETFTITLNDPTGGAVLGTPSTATVTISDNDTCSYQLSQTARTSPAAGEGFSIGVAAPVGCAWSAVSNSGFISITSGAVGTGNGAVALSVQPNGSGVPRLGTVNIAGHTLTITQPEIVPEVPTLQFSQTSYESPEGAGSAAITLTRSKGTIGAVSVTLRTVDDPAAVPCDPTLRRPDGSEYPKGTAYARCDYATTIETISWADGDAQPKTVMIPLVDDAHHEGDEILQLMLLDASGVAVVGAPSAATLTITDNDGAEMANPIFTTPFFVRMHYLDFLNREPEAGEPWSGVLNRCPDADSDPDCGRLLVSQSFFGSPEFRMKGFYVYNFYRVAFGRLPTYDEIIPDMRSVSAATEQEVYRKRAAFPLAFTARAEFKILYEKLGDTAYVNTLMDRYALQQITTPDPANPEGGVKVTLTRGNLISRLSASGEQALTRAQVLRALVESNEVSAREYNGAFVAMQYYGYLRRTPEEDGYRAWLRVINQDPNNVRIMVNGFMNSTEYRLRFGRP